jgi:Protein of unknown function (DUF3592)
VEFDLFTPGSRPAIMIWLEIGKLIPYAILGICLAGIAQFAWRIIRSRKRTVHTTGVVVRFSSRRWYSRLRCPHVEFLDRDGIGREFHSRWGAGGKPWPVGTRVKVSYDPDDPDDAELAFSETRLVLVLMLLVFSIGTTVAGFEVIKHWR